jgi:hypothetical protein
MTAQNEQATQAPVIADTFTWPPTDDPRLIGTRCKTCGTVSFPRSPVCRNPYCKNKTEVEEILLSRRGILATFTLICYPPPWPFIYKPPFVPFPIGNVLLPEGITVLGQITGCKYEDLKIGMEAELVLEKLFEEDGKDFIGWRWKVL